ncbi:MAG: cell division topological specificity factor MinE [Francisellaceae bacterium]|nr:cell division topological specificity factor MinE [Francisellaceae bacterium]
MSFKLLNIFKFSDQKSAKMAKERLQIIVSHQRSEDSLEHDFLPKLREELITVISKYVKVDENKINVQLQKNGGLSVLELNIQLSSLKKPLKTN